MINTRLYRHLVELLLLLEILKDQIHHQTHQGGAV